MEKLVTALISAIIRNANQRVATVFLDISVLHFKDGMNPQNFADVSQSLFPVIAAAAATALAPTGGLAAPTGSIPVTNIFNYAALPSDVHLCYDQHANTSKMMTPSTMDIEFASSTPNRTVDPSSSTMRTNLSYLNPPVTGNRLITQNGAVFNLASQGTDDGAKECMRNVPPCLGKSTTANRNWSNVFSIHAAVQPYFCFCLEANATAGFTFGDDIDLVKFDVPGKFSDRGPFWAMTIWTALSKSHVFSAGSPMKLAVQINWSKGYDALHAIVVPFLVMNSLPFSSK